MSPQEKNHLTDKASWQNAWFTYSSVMHALDGLVKMLNSEKLTQWTSSHRLNPQKQKTVGIAMAGNIHGLLIIAAAATIILPLLNAIKNPKGVVKSLFGIGFLVVVFIVAYVISSDEVTPRYATYGVGESGSKMIGAGLIMFYITLFISIIGIIFSEINKALK